MALLQRLGFLMAGRPDLVPVPDRKPHILLHPGCCDTTCSVRTGVHLTGFTMQAVTQRPGSFSEPSEDGQPQRRLSACRRLLAVCLTQGGSRVACWDHGTRWTDCSTLLWGKQASRSSVPGAVCRTLFFQGLTPGLR